MISGEVEEISVSFFFQAEDGIRDTSVTGVQTCALPISALEPGQRDLGGEGYDREDEHRREDPVGVEEIGRASCRERVWVPGLSGSLKKKDNSRIFVGTTIVWSMLVWCFV